jgi:hypothetical protein
MELHPTQKTVAADNHDYRVVVCGRQWGKTTLAVLEMIACAYAHKDREIGYMASTFDQARNIAWAMLKDYSRGAWDKTPNESRLELSLRTQDKGVSKIVLGGYENIETYRGRQFDLLVPDEVALMRNFVYNWNAVLEPTLAFRKGKALFLGTPKGFDHLYDLWTKGQKEDQLYKSWRFTSYDNPYLPKERIEQAKKTSTEDYFAQEYLADFRKHTGLVYKEFMREVHVIQPFDPPEGWQIYRGFDWGDTNPSVCLWVVVDGDDNWFIMDEFYQPLAGKGIDYIAGIVNANKFSKRVSQSWADPSGKVYISDMANRGNIFITPANKEVGTNFNSWVRFGIEKVAERLKTIPGHTVNSVVRTSGDAGGSTSAGSPKLFICSNCTNTIREFETYRWKEKSVSQAQDLNEPDVPEKANDHALDALRYFAVSYQKQTKHTNNLPQFQEPVDSELGI